MATYKVIQDIEAEDKLVGPLSLRQFIYAGIAGLCTYLGIFALSKGFSLLLVMLSPVILFTGFFAFPWGRDQPTEVWALAKIRFYLKSRKRLWDQSGMMELVTVTAPKRIEKTFTNGLAPHEVQSHLTALASMLDSRGWAVKNVTGPYTSPLTATPTSERLMDIAAMPNQVQDGGLTAADDMLDSNNPKSHRLQEMVAASSTSRRQKLITQLKQAVTPGIGTPSLPKPVAQPAQPAQPPVDYWFLNQPLDRPAPDRGKAVFTDAQVVHAGDEDTGAAPTAAEAALATKLKEQHARSQLNAGQHHLKTIQPLGAQAAQAVVTATAPNQTQTAPQPTPRPVTPPANPATMNLANNNDLSVAAIQRVANKKDAGNSEVVISLHDHD